jgi:hypothetical protein
VAFQTASTNLDPVDTDVQRDVYVRDLATSGTTLISRAAGATGTKASGGQSNAGGMSTDGRYVSFSTTGTGIEPDDIDNVEDAFVRDLDTARLVLVSRASGAAGAKGDARSLPPALSSDGHFVAFSSIASNLAPGADNTFYDVFRRDLLSPPAGNAATPGPGPAQAQPLSPPSPKLAVAFGKARYRLVHGRRLKISYTSSSPAHAVLEIRKGKRVLARVRQTARKGKNRISWNSRYRRRGSKRATASPAGRYTLRLAAKAGGHSASAKARLTVVRR